MDKKTQSKDSLRSVVLTQGETILIQNSKIPKNKNLYGNLYLAIQGYINVTNKDLNENERFDKKSQATILANKKELMNNVMEEWKGVACNEITDEEIHCQLCSRPNKLIYYIQNQKTGAELHVGSTCINRFNKIGNIKQIKKNWLEKNKQLEKEKRKIEFSEIDLEDLNYVEELENKFKEIDIVLPYNLYISLKNKLYELNSLRTNYIKNGGEFQEVEKEYFELKKESLSLWVKAEDFYNINKNNSLICNKRVGDWIKDKDENIWISISKNNGLFSNETLKFIYEPEFIKEHIKEFNQCREDKDIRILRKNGNNIVFQIKNRRYPNGLIFETRAKWFMENIGCHCLTETNYKFGKKDIDVEKIIIPETSRNLEEILNRVNYVLEKIGYVIEVSRITNYIYYKRTGKQVEEFSIKKQDINKIYKKINFSMIIESFKPIIFSEDDEMVKKAFKIKLRILIYRGSWITKQEKEDNERIAGQETALKKQREFIAYK